MSHPLPQGEREGARGSAVGYNQHMNEPQRDSGDSAAPSSTVRASAFAVHVFTASGAALGLLALFAATEGDWPAMFAWLGLALFVDGIDGTFARYLRVAEVLPRWSGDVLDFMVDFLTYVVVPAYALAVGGLLPDALAVPLALVIVVTGALYCADRRMKTDDNYFRGFPVLWNLVAFYLFLLRPDPWVAAAAIGLLAVLTFVPFPFVHPMQVKRARALTIALLVAWTILAVLALWQDLRPQPWIIAGLSVVGTYFLGAGLLRRV
jgi:phosphatidylcholine synthase